MKKIDKEFVLSDSSVNCYGFRLLTEGYMLEEFAKNPVGYYMHNRDAGVLVKWDDLEKKGDTIIGYPNINEANPRGQRTIDEINGGFLNAASVGQIVIIESVDDPSLRLPGQTGLTITKWYNRECSLVDLPGNFNSLQLYDVDDNLLNINLFSKAKNLTYDHTSFKNDPNTGDKLDVNKLLKEAIKNKDITTEQAGQLREQYQNIPQKLQEVLHQFADMRITYLNGMNWDELDKKGLLPEFKEKTLTLFERKYYMRFEKSYKDPEEKPQNATDETLDKLINYAIEIGATTHEELKGMEWNTSTTFQPDILRGIIERAIASKTNSYEDMTWKELDKGGCLGILKKLNFQSFKQKFKDEFGIDYKENGK